MVSFSMIDRVKLDIISGNEIITRSLIPSVNVDQTSNWSCGSCLVMGEIFNMCEKIGKIGEKNNMN